MPTLSKKNIFIFSVLIIISISFVYKINKSKNSLSEARADIENKMQYCYKQSAKSVCYKEIAVDFLSKYPLPEILKIFDSSEKKPEFFENCHEVAHYLGQEEYKKIKILRNVFLESSRACLGGVYHGAVEGYFMDKKISYEPKDEEKLKTEIGTICGKPENYIRPQDFTECNHGLGHALMYVTDNDLKRALDYCDVLGSVNERELCYTGSLMANGDSFESDTHPSKYVKENDPLYPCNILKKHQQKQCYTYGTLTRFQFDLKKSIEICLGIPKEFQEDCFKTLGRDRTMVSSDPEELKSQCSEIKDESFRKDCISGTSYNLLIRFGTNSDIPITYCKITDNEYKKNCYSNIERALKKVTADTKIRENFCLKINDIDYKKECLDSII